MLKSRTENTVFVAIIDFSDNSGCSVISSKASDKYSLYHTKHNKKSPKTLAGDVPYLVFKGLLQVGTNDKYCRIKATLKIDQDFFQSRDKEDMVLGRDFIWHNRLVLGPQHQFDVCKPTQVVVSFSNMVNNVLWTCVRELFHLRVGTKDIPALPTDVISRISQFYCRLVITDFKQNLLDNYQRRLRVLSLENVLELLQQVVKQQQQQ